MMGMDQDDIVLGPLDHDQIPRQRQHTDQREPKRRRGRREDPTVAATPSTR